VLTDDVLVELRDDLARGQRLDGGRGGLRQIDGHGDAPLQNLDGQVVVRIDADPRRDLHGLLRDRARVEVGVRRERLGGRQRVRAAGPDGHDAVVRLDQIAGARQQIGRGAVHHDEHRLEAPEHAVRAPLLRQLHRGSFQVAAVLLQFRLEPRKERERIGGGAGDPGQDAVVVQAPDLAGALLDHGVPERDLPVAGHHGLPLVTDRQDGRCVKHAQKLSVSGGALAGRQSCPPDETPPPRGLNPTLYLGSHLMAILLQNWTADCQVYLRWGRTAMKAFSQKLGIAVAGLLLAAGPALAQGRPDSGGGAGAGGDRGGGCASAGGGVNASSGGGGGGNIASGGGGGGSSSSGGGGDVSSSPSVSSVSSPSISMGDHSFRSSAPEHRVSYSATSGARSHTASSGDQATPRSSGGSSSGSSGGSASAPSRGTARGGDRASTRRESTSGEGAVSRGVGAASRNNDGSRRANEGVPTNNANDAKEVPDWSRPRGDRPATDTAVPRVGPQPPRDSGDRNRGYGYYYDPYYYGGGAGGSASGRHLPPP